MVANGRNYWSRRNGRSPAPTALTPVQIRILFASLVSEFEQRGYFQEAFGYECVDDGFVPGFLGQAINERLLLILGYEEVWPLMDVEIETWDDDKFLDVIEAFFDWISVGDPESGRYHSFSQCGWHFSKFDHEPARTEYRNRVNEILSRSELNLELNESGELMHEAPSGLSTLMEASLPGLPAHDDELVRAAIHKFRSRASTTTQRRDAVRDLADVLENNRKDIKAEMFGPDERALFEIANKFFIRHNKPTERRDYDREAWWSWLFYLYLDSIALVLHLKDRQG